MNISKKKLLILAGVLFLSAVVGALTGTDVCKSSPGACEAVASILAAL